MSFYTILCIYYVGLLAGILVLPDVLDAAIIRFRRRRSRAAFLLVDLTGLPMSRKRRGSWNN